MEEARKKWVVIQNRIDDNLEIGCAIIFMFLHALFIILFSWKHIDIMVWVNIGSVICYIIEVFLAKKRRSIMFYNLLSLEILIHIAAGEVCIGGQGGFYIYSYCVINYLYFQSFITKKSKLSIWNIVMWLAVYTCMPVVVVIWDHFKQPIYQNTDIGFMLNVVNTVVVAIFINYFLIISGREIKKYEHALIDKNQQLEQISYVDPLTSLWNRRRLYLDVEAQINETEAYCIILGDIDDFKKINDTYGHECGDLVLMQISQIIQQEIRKIGHAYRWGGEEILILLPSCSKKEAVMHAEHILERIKQMIVSYHEKKVSVTMTMGIAEGYGRSALDVITRKADDCLYIGKAKGKAQVKY